MLFFGSICLVSSQGRLLFPRPPPSLPFSGLLVEKFRAAFRSIAHHLCATLPIKLAGSAQLRRQNVASLMAGGRGVCFARRERPETNPPLESECLRGRRRRPRSRMVAPRRLCPGTALPSPHSQRHSCRARPRVKQFHHPTAERLVIDCITRATLTLADSRGRPACGRPAICR